MDVTLAALAHTRCGHDTLHTTVSVRPSNRDHAQTQIHVPETVVASTGEYLAGQQHRHDRLAAASSDAAAAEISSVKFVLSTPEARVRSWSLEAASAQRFKLRWDWVVG